MIKALRIILLLAATVAAMLGIGWFHENIVKPQEATFAGKQEAWDKSKLPLTVSAPTTQYRTALRHAVGLINSQVGCDLFATSEGEAVLVIQEGSIEVDGESQDWAAGAYVAKDMSRGEIVLFRPLMVGTDLHVIHHELGHILDLEHDRAYSMKPQTEEVLSGPMSAAPRFTDKDAAALREVYCD